MKIVRQFYNWIFIPIVTCLIMSFIYLSLFFFSQSISAAPLGVLNIDSLKVKDQRIEMKTNDGQHVVIDFINPAVFRIQASNNDKFPSAKGEAIQDQCENFNCQSEDFNPDELPDIVINSNQGEVEFTVNNQGEYHLVQTDKLSLRINHAKIKDKPLPLTFDLYKADNSTLLWKELKPIYLGDSVDSYDRDELQFKNGNLKTTQTFSSEESEHYYGGGQQNGEFEFNNKTMEISYNGWKEFGRPNPAPFYMSDKGYGVLRHTWRNGAYDFRDTDRVTSSFNENRFDAYYFVGDTLGNIINEYTNLTGRPHLLARWAYYLGDADCYENKNGSYPEGWPTEPGSTIDVVKQVIVPYKEYDMPLGWVLPNDGYSCGYSDLKNTADQLNALGIKTGLWTQKKLDQIKQEVIDGIRVYKLDVAWTGYGKLYSLSANKDAHTGLTENSDTRGMIWTVMGWAGTQRYSVAWTGDQYTNWDYIRWHIPTFIGSGLSGQAYASSDVNGIWGHGAETYTRDLQFKAFTPVLIAMSGWDNKERKHAWWHDSYRDINRKFLMLKSQLMPYMYKYAYDADRTGAPLVRAMTYEFPNDPRLKGEEFKYQYMYGQSLLVAPVYDAMETNGGWRKNIYLPQGEWIDFWDGTRTSAIEGGMLLEEYPITMDKIPVLVKAGAIIPMYLGARSDALQAKDHLIVQLYPHGDSSFTLYEDDGETRAYKEQEAYAETEITANAPESGVAGDITLTVNPANVHNDYEGQISERSYDFQILSLLKPLSIEFDSGPLDEVSSMEDLTASQEGWYYDASDRYGTLHIKIGKQSVYQPLSLFVDIDENAPMPKTPPYKQSTSTTNGSGGVGEIAVMMLLLAGWLRRYY
ncbi:TIM-barrel domain-containing protein [Vibrio mimicus]|uniref:glycoside hydrolase family 31 protein n=1 Tax=Vibrio mimicus TaxID=674 RepID=UPI0001BAE108|nr:TIM-barrel domain-containing protein [Vibrio mimicus]EEY38287.1 glycosyl hydrolase family 31/fibronectin type III domain protein [Vibrio mimicus MB451]